MNLIELIRRVNDKASGIRFLQSKGILPEAKFCSNGHEMKLECNDNRDRWRCRARACREDKQLRKNTWLEGSRLPYDTIVLFIYSWSHDLATIDFCEKELSMNHNTTVDWCNYLREVCASSLLRNPILIGGPGFTVEIDESIFSRRKSCFASAMGFWRCV